MSVYIMFTLHALVYRMCCNYFRSGDSSFLNIAAKTFRVFLKQFDIYKLDLFNSNS